MVYFACPASALDRRTKAQLQAGGFEVHNEDLFGEFQFRYGSAEKEDIPFDEDSKMGSVFSGTGVSTDRKPIPRYLPRGKSFSVRKEAAGPLDHASAKNAAQCPGPYYVGGAALAPLRIYVCPPGGTSCNHLILTWTKHPCMCSYRCFRWWIFRGCTITCQGFSITIWGHSNFSCNVRGIKLSGFPGWSKCPMPNVSLCSA